MTSMKEIARIASVSTGTVSHVLNNTARVREPLRQRVLDAVRASGYQPSQLARGLRRDKTDIIAMIIPDIDNPFFPGVVRGVEDVAFANGYRLVLCNTDNDHAKEMAHLGALRTYLPAGLIVIPSSFSDLTTQANAYRQSGAAVICIDRLPRDWNGDAVTVDNFDGAFQGTSYLIQLGHRRIAAITGPLHLTNAQDRYERFRVRDAECRSRDSAWLRAGGFIRSQRRLLQGQHSAWDAATSYGNSGVQRYDRAGRSPGHPQPQLPLPG